jgi:hypothetical protein
VFGDFSPQRDVDSPDIDERRRYVLGRGVVLETPLWKMVGVCGDNSYRSAFWQWPSGRGRQVVSKVADAIKLDVSTRDIMRNTITATVGDTQAAK